MKVKCQHCKAEYEAYGPVQPTSRCVYCRKHVGLQGVESLPATMTRQQVGEKFRHSLAEIYKPYQEKGDGAFEEINFGSSPPPPQTPSQSVAAAQVPQREVTVCPRGLFPMLYRSMPEGSTAEQRAHALIKTVAANCSTLPLSDLEIMAACEIRMAEDCARAEVRNAGVHQPLFSSRHLAQKMREQVIAIINDNPYANASQLIMMIEQLSLE